MKCIWTRFFTFVYCIVCDSHKFCQFLFWRLRLLYVREVCMPMLHETRKSRVLLHSIRASCSPWGNSNRDLLCLPSFSMFIANGNATLTYRNYTFISQRSLGAYIIFIDNKSPLIIKSQGCAFGVFILFFNKHKDITALLRRGHGS